MTAEPTPKPLDSPSSAVDQFSKLYLRVGFAVTNLVRPAERIVTFYNQRGTAKHGSKKGKGAIQWKRLSCRSFAANAVRLQLHVLAYNLCNFMRTLVTPKTAELWSPTSLREKVIKIGAKSSAMAATLPSKLPRSQCCARCSRKSCR